MLPRYIVKKDDLSASLADCDAWFPRYRPAEQFRCFLAGVVVVLIVSLALLPEKIRAEERLSENDQFTINLDNVDIGVLIEQVSRQTGRNFIIDPRVRANVTVVSAEPVDAEGLYKLFLSVLEVHGYAAVTSGSFTKIVPMAVGVQSAVPVLTDRSVNGDELVTDVVPVQHVPVQQLAELLRPLLPSTATIGAEASSNSIVITDRASNTKRIREIILELDRPQ
jgi:general secretion pathway protein D